MTEKAKSPIINPHHRDSSSKIIFSDNILASQFLRDYADMEILRHIQPEDIEDVSERYVPLYSTERDSDTVKKVDISRYLPHKIQSMTVTIPRASEGNRTLTEDARQTKTINLPLYVISLIEHKTKAEYNIVMQLLRYI